MLKDQIITDVISLDEKKLKAITNISKTITSIENANECGEFDGELTLLRKIKSNIKDTIISGEGRLASMILE